MLPTKVVQKVTLTLTSALTLTLTLTLTLGGQEASAPGAVRTALARLSHGTPAGRTLTLALTLTLTLALTLALALSLALALALALTLTRHTCWSTLG